jgi:hypothetical protein
MAAAAAAAADDDDDEYGFSDPDLDYLPIDTLQEFETNALRATQQPQDHHYHDYRDYRDNHDHYQNHRQASPATPESDYGLDDDQVVDLDDTASHPPHIKTEPHHHLLHSQPPRSQADPDALLLRIRQVRHPSMAPRPLLTLLPARAGQTPRETGRRRPQSPAADQSRRG